LGEVSWLYRRCWLVPETRRLTDAECSRSSCLQTKALAVLLWLENQWIFLEVPSRMPCDWRLLRPKHRQCFAKRLFSRHQSWRRLRSMRRVETQAEQNCVVLLLPLLCEPALELLVPRLQNQESQITRMALDDKRFVSPIHNNGSPCFRAVSARASAARRSSSWARRAASAALRSSSGSTAGAEPSKGRVLNCQIILLSAAKRVGVPGWP
jgi:hypothetical protein